MGGEGREVENGSPLFESRRGKGMVWYRLYSCSLFVGIFLILVYRATHIPGNGEKGRWVWFGAFGAELWFGFYWLLTQSVRWNPIYRRTFKDRLSKIVENELPGVDVFVCTADLTLEPPTMVINTVLSVMAYDYPPDKISVYLSDDGGSNLTFYALLEASHFARSWIPFCKKFKVEPRSPDAYFSQSPEEVVGPTTVEWMKIKKLYKEMESRINAAVKLGGISEQIHKHKGFSEWNSATTSHDHQAIVQILIDGREQKSCDNEGCALPTLVYMAREKRPQHHHNFKAGAMNALIRVSAGISNGPIILNVDCDMYSSNSESVKDALCFFMDKEKGHEFAYVQFFQHFGNVIRNDLYANAMRIIGGVDFNGLDGLGGPMYVGSGCFHRRESLCGRHYNKRMKAELKGSKPEITEATADTLEARVKDLATCTYEENSEWGNEIGLKYGCPVEDVITGLAIQCRGWKSIYFNPQRNGFVGLAPITLSQGLVQHKRWSEGDFQIFLSKYCPLLYGHGRIKLGLQMGYSIYCLWAPCALPTLYYVVIPSLCLLNGISLFPSVSNLWFTPFAFITANMYAFSLAESVWHGMTLQAWWNEQRMWIYKRTTSYLFAFIDAILKVFGVNKSTFIITSKVADEDVAKRYEQEIMEFGSASPMFTILATIAILNLLCLAGGVKTLLMDEGFQILDSQVFQILICGSLVVINMPIYQAMFIRHDSGCMPTATTFASITFAFLACLVPIL